jgi:hypothetical protein
MSKHHRPPQPSSPPLRTALPTNGAVDPLELAKGGGGPSAPLVSLMATPGVVPESPPPAAPTEPAPPLEEEEPELVENAALPPVAREERHPLQRVRYVGEKRMTVHYGGQSVGLYPGKILDSRSYSDAFMRAAEKQGARFASA